MNLFSIDYILHEKTRRMESDYELFLLRYIYFFYSYFFQKIHEGNNQYIYYIVLYGGKCHLPFI